MKIFIYPVLAVVLFTTPFSAYADCGDEEQEQEDYSGYEFEADEE